jgi:D-alanine-D-alanine ligase-like ATP-grasp enzyme
MKKFLKIYNDSESRYVAINADEVNFLSSTPTTLEFFYSVKNSNKNNVNVNYDAVDDETKREIKNVVITAFQKLMCKSYSKATIDVKLPATVTSIIIN